jgi:flagellar FliL protein
MAEKAVEEIESPPKSKIGLKKLLIIAGAILVVGAGATFGIVKYLRGAGTAVAAAQKVKKEAVLGMMNLDPFLVNLADKDAVRFVKVTFRLGMSEKEEEEGGADPIFMAAARDQIISLLTAKTSEEILTAEGKEKLRRDVMTRLNSVLHKGKILEVYIVDFVVQL